MRLYRCGLGHHRATARHRLPPHRPYGIRSGGGFTLDPENFRNLLNHPILNTPNVTVGGGTFGYVTSFGAARTLQFSGRVNF